MNLGPLPVANLVVLEVGLAVGLVLLAIDMSLKYVGIGILAAALIVALLRWRGRWFTQWVGLTMRYSFRSHDRVAEPLPPSSVEAMAAEETAVTGADDARVNLLRIAVPDLVVAHGVDHERQQVGLAWHDGSWTAVLLVEPTPAMITQAGDAPSLPLAALAPCLEDRGVVLDSIQMIWHCYPGSAALPSDSPALSSYMEVLGPLPAAARRTTWVAIRLDPKRCPAAIRERGGGVVGAHRALIGALSRVRNALESQGVPTRPLDPDELLRASISAAELTSVSRLAGQGDAAGAVVRRDRGRHRPRELRDHRLAEGQDHRQPQRADERPRAVGDGRDVHLTGVGRGQDRPARSGPAQRAQPA